MTAGTGDAAAAAAIEVKQKGHAETPHGDEPADDKIDNANGDLSARQEDHQDTAETKGTTPAQNGLTQPQLESAAVDQPPPLVSPAGRLSGEDRPAEAALVSTPPAVSAQPPAAASPAVSPAAAATAAAVVSAVCAAPARVCTPPAMTASQQAPAPSVPATVCSPPSLVSAPPALVSTPSAAAPVRPQTASPAAASPVGRKRSAETAAEPAPVPRQARRSSSERGTAPPDPPVPHRTVEMIESSLHKLKREVKAIDLLARQKEREWDNLLRLRRAKEETFQRLRRKREVLLQQPAAEAALAAAAQAPSAPPPRPAERPAGGAPPSSAPTYSVSSAMWALKQEQQRQQQQQQEQQRLQQQRLAQQQHAAPPPQFAPRAAGVLRPLRPVAVPPFVGSVASSVARVAQPPRVAAAEPHEPQYREILAQVARLNQRLATPADQAAADAAAAASAAAAAHQSSLARLLMEKKKQSEPALLNEMLKPQMAVRPSVNGPLLRPAAPAPAAPRPAPPPPPPPPPPPATEVPLCQGCGRRQAQFVCAGCGHQWYCSRDCQVEAWDSHADDCSG